MANSLKGVGRRDIVHKINLLMDNLINIKDETGEFLLKLDDGRIIDTKGWGGWEWTHGIGLYGMYKYYELTQDEKALCIINEWFTARFAERSTTKNVNTVSPFLTLAYLYEDTKIKSYLPYLEQWLDWVMYEMPRTDENGLQHIVYNSENKQQIWDDTLMMCVLPLAKVGKLFNNLAYIEEAKKQFLLHIKYLADKKTGLWFHGWNFEGRHNFANALWARGNCWITIAIPEFLELLDLNEDDSIKEFLLDALKNQVEALAKCQDEHSGLWHTILDDDTSYLEASATAGFAYGILKAVRKRYIDKKYEEIAIKAIQGILNNISEDGELQNVSFGTPVFNTIQEYKDIPLTSMPYGQSLAILCLSEYLHSYI
ncbi:beta-galactosidase BglB [Pelosinus propionicus]|uniref:Unsaturated rhamnogalacturonyl hydrolase n=1 Tax=Pelosinus propionicus DSM 13327 TaxID=1123291 RepID=A0A1I4MFQ2_9FIRM|nr:glycoside hydrolase family 88 protein [Pelosinus propionicus]SFM01817.1 unsaturated rhamnogalacturonyl hydrolase [Pelosinus propionicus DSM 13327]